MTYKVTIQCETERKFFKLIRRLNKAGREVCEACIKTLTVKTVTKNGEPAF